MCNIPRVAVCCSVLQCVAVYCSLPSIATPYMCALLTSYHRGALQCVATCSACCNMLWFVAECDMPRVAACCSVLQPTQHCHSTHVLESNHTHEECIWTSHSTYTNESKCMNQSPTNSNEFVNIHMKSAYGRVIVHIWMHLHIWINHTRTSDEFVNIHMTHMPVLPSCHTHESVMAHLCVCVCVCVRVWVHVCGRVCACSCVCARAHQ